MTYQLTRSVSKMETKYKGYIIAKYRNTKNGIRWSVEKDGIELMFDQTRKWMCIEYIDSKTRVCNYRNKSQ